MPGSVIVETHSTPAVLEIVGRSMEPALRPGQRVRVLAASNRPRPGDVVVLRSGLPAVGQPAFIVHRLVLLVHVGARPILFHRGDARGRVGLTQANALAGHVSGVLAADGTVNALVRPDRAARLRFLAARLRCHAYVALRHLVWHLGLRSPLPASVRRWSQRLLG